MRTVCGTLLSADADKSLIRDDLVRAVGKEHNRGAVTEYVDVNVLGVPSRDGDCARWCVAGGEVLGGGGRLYRVCHGIAAIAVSGVELLGQCSGEAFGAPTSVVTVWAGRELGGTVPHARGGAPGARGS